MGGNGHRFLPGGVWVAVLTVAITLWLWSGGMQVVVGPGEPMPTDDQLVSKLIGWVALVLSVAVRFAVWVERRAR